MHMPKADGDIMVMRFPSKRSISKRHDDLYSFLAKALSCLVACLEKTRSSGAILKCRFVSNFRGCTTDNFVRKSRGTATSQAVGAWSKVQCRSTCVLLQKSTLDEPTAHVDPETTKNLEHSA